MAFNNFNFVGFIILIISIVLLVLLGKKIINKLKLRENKQ